MDNLFLAFTLVLGMATLFSLLARFLRIPLIVAYIFTGVVLTTFGTPIIRETPVLHFLPEIGIAFLLFLIGMELDYREMLKVGKGAVIASFVQLSLSGIAGFAMALLLGFTREQGVYIGIALAFSSTIAVVKLLAERHDESSLHGRLSVGILLLEDLLAIVVLMFLSLSTSALSIGLTNSLPLVSLILKSLFFFSLTMYVARYILPSIVSYIAHSTELLFLSAIALCFSWISLAHLLGFSMEIGAFLAGLALASSPYRLQIAGRIKPLRDFFIALFFINLGAGANLLDVATHPTPFLLFTSYAIVVKPLIFMIVLSALGYRKHSTFLTSINLTQISEFSLIVLSAGQVLGIVDSSLLSTFALVGAVSIALSSILIIHSKTLYKLVYPLITHLERDKSIATVALKKEPELKNHIIVVGCHQSGGKVVEYIAEKQGDQLVAVDFNPEIVKELAGKGIRVVFGDISDPDIVDEVNVKAAKLIVSTVRDFDDNHLLLLEAKRKNHDAFVILAAQTEEDAEKLKKKGADKVIIPLALEGQHIVNFLSREWFNK